MGLVMLIEVLLIALSVGLIFTGAVIRALHPDDFKGIGWVEITGWAFLIIMFVECLI